MTTAGTVQRLLHRGARTSAIRYLTLLLAVGTLAVCATPVVGQTPGDSTGDVFSVETGREVGAAVRACAEARLKQQNAAADEYQQESHACKADDRTCRLTAFAKYNRAVNAATCQYEQCQLQAYRFSNDCDGAKSAAVAAAAAQYQCAVHQCESDKTCLSAAYTKWITAGKAAEKTYAQCRLVAQAPLDDSARTSPDQDKQVLKGGAGTSGPPQRTPTPAPPDGPVSQPPAGPRTPPKQPPRGSTPDRICTLRDLATLVFERYGSGFPIATARVANRPNAYILLLQGMDSQEVQWKDAAQAYFRNAGSPELRLIENLLRLANGAPYQQGVIDAVNQLPPGATLLVAGHSLGAIEAQNIVGALRGIRPDVRVSQVFSFGAPVVGSRAPGPQYLDIKATKGAPDLVAVPALDRGVSTGIINVNGDTNIDLYDTAHGSHFVYPKSPDLAALGLDGRAATTGVCLTIEVDSLQSYPLGDPSSNTRWPTACPDVSFRGQAPMSIGNMFNGPGWQSWSQLQAQAWQRATTVRERNVVSERIGEKGMEIAARDLGYKPLLLPGEASDTPQGFDAVYRAPDGTYVVAEAKGGYNGDDLDDILGYGYRCRQGTLEWARRAAERILIAAKTGSQEQKIAQELRSRILTQAPGFGVRVEVFQTEHNNGVPGVTRRYVTARSQ